MKQESIKTDDFLKDSLIVLRETFEGSPEGASSAYLDRGIGVFTTIDNVSHEVASVRVNETTIAAHTEHLKFYMDRLREFMEGRVDDVKWEQSWLIEFVDEREWEILRSGLRESYETLLFSIAGAEKWDQNNIGDFLAIIAHSGYHLGAIRQILKPPNRKIPIHNSLEEFDEKSVSSSFSRGRPGKSARILWSYTRLR